MLEEIHKLKGGFDGVQIHYFVRTSQYDNTFSLLKNLNVFSQYKLLVSCIYVLMGLAIVSMSINLIQVGK